MDRLHVPKSAELQALFWRSEILQVLYWLHGEGLGDVVDAAVIERFVGVDVDTATAHMDRLVTEGYLVPVGAAYTLSEEGLREGAQEFASAFADLTRPAHGECSADCWCHASPEEAAACFDARHQGQDHP